MTLLHTIRICLLLCLTNISPIVPCFEHSLTFYYLLDFQQRLEGLPHRQPQSLLTTPHQPCNYNPPLDIIPNRNSRSVPQITRGKREI